MNNRPATPPSAASSPTPVPAPPRTVAAFDFDGTLTRGGSVLPFLVAVRGFWTVFWVVARLSPRLIHSGLVGGTAADEAKEKMFTRLLGGMPMQLIDERSAIFAERHLARRLRHDARTRLKWHQSQGHHVVIVSASPECYVRYAGELLGVDGVLATRLAIGGGGLLTGDYEGKNCRGAEKYARLVVHLRAHGLLGGGDDQLELWAYGNSRGDLRLLRAADQGVDAGLLGPLGRLRKFPRLADVVRQTSAQAQPGLAAMPTTRPE